MSIYQEWMDAKAAEAAAIEARRKIEDSLLSIYKIPEAHEGTETFQHDGHIVKIVGRMNRTVDGDRLQDIARDNGLSESLGTLFRWKPEINMAAWKAASDNITKILAEAITTKPGRPSFTITKKED